LIWCIVTFLSALKIAYFLLFSNVISIETSRAARKNTSNMVDGHRWRHCKFSIGGALWKSCNERRHINISRTNWSFALILEVRIVCGQSLFPFKLGHDSIHGLATRVRFVKTEKFALLHQ
jgi:hypothetical protein